MMSLQYSILVYPYRRPHQCTTCPASSLRVSLRCCGGRCMLPLGPNGQHSLIAGSRTGVSSRSLLAGQPLGVYFAPIRSPWGALSVSFLAAIVSFGFCPKTMDSGVLINFLCTNNSSLEGATELKFAPFCTSWGAFYDGIFYNQN